jgi:hypothetical protein
LRIQESLRYITAKTAIWRARLQNEGNELRLELASPWRKSLRTQLSPPISPRSIDFHRHGWRLFGKYLEYVVATTEGTFWNPVAYHLNNACEATAGSLDAWAIGVSVAVEAVASLISVADDKEKVEREQSDLQDLYDRVTGQINAMSNRRAQDTLYGLAATGHLQEDYIKAWVYLRNRHVHPTLKDLKKPDQVDHQTLVDRILRVEVLLRQLTFKLIGYEGPFTDYGTRGNQAFPSQEYPMERA